jgi:2-polyprenyl-6-methoxyphenol hydroxylase-like FAD-dependent oxidoreductase
VTAGASASSGRRAVVVGAGIGGLAAALGLVRDGWQVEVAERADRVQVLGTALGIWAEAQDVLRRLGLGALVEQGSRPIGGAVLRNSEGRVLVAMPEDPVSVVLISRSDLVQELLAALPAGVVQTGRSVNALDELPAEVDLVVAADGVRSGLRRELLGDVVSPRYSGYLAFRGIVEGEYGPQGEVWGRGCLFGITSHRAGWTNWYCALRTAADFELQLDGLRRLLAVWPDPVPQVLDQVGESYLRHTISDLDAPLPTTTLGRTVIIGDAAHAMTPHLGQGACQALLDADALTAVLAARASIPEALAAYDRRRRRPGQRVAARSRVMGRISQATTWAPVRDTVIGGVGTLLPATRRGRRQP